MPLHNVIPLCNFNYVRDIYSGATFIYDGTNKINKDEGQKVTEVERVIEIEKINTKRMYSKEVSEMDRSLIKRSLVPQTNEIYIEHSREYKRESPDIEILRSKVLYPPQRELNKNESLDLEIEQRELSKSESLELIQDVLEMEFTTSKDFENVTPLLMDQVQSKNVQIHEDSSINKVTALNVDDRHECNINKIQDKNLDVDSSIEFTKDDVLNLGKSEIMELAQYKKDSSLELFTGEINKNDSQSMEHSNKLELDKGHTSKFIDKAYLKDLDKANPARYTEPLSMVEIDRNNIRKFMYRDKVFLIGKYDRAMCIDKISEKLIDKDKNKRLLGLNALVSIEKARDTHLMQPITIVEMFKTESENYLDRLNNTDIYKSQENYLDMLHTTDIFKILDKFTDRLYIKDMFKLDTVGLDYAESTPIYKDHQKPILKLDLKPIYKDQSRSLNGSLVKEIYLPRDPNYIDVTKRWWWLSDSSPKDRKIIPNRDYAKMIDLLSNPNYEYLRYTNHPIDWGKGWGIDHNIPPAAISIEIMLDLTNIVTMAWHKSAHGWLRVSGKEGIQLLMELIYDWYCMSTSNPNHSYYRAYRWLRWEAEKVYFLDTKNGLQAIGILVRNLREYLKFHHFNRVPIWRNPKAMDEERNFNRKAQNGDLIVDLNKIKGKRHYYIESQNFEKQKLIQAKL